MHSSARVAGLAAPVFVLGLAGCALEPPYSQPPPEPRIVFQPAPPSAADQLMAYAAGVRKLEAREFAGERDQARMSFMKDRSELSRLRYAMLLALSPGAMSADDGELIALLEPLVTGPLVTSPETDVRVLAVLLLGAAQERRKLREQLRDAVARLNFVKRDDSKEAEVRALRARVEELEKKLNALKSIDRSVNRRAESTTK
jgi:hypothetical protein